MKRSLLIGLTLTAVGLGALGMLAATSPSQAVLTSPPVDLIAGQDWAHFTGASQAAAGIQIKPLGRNIVNQDGTPNQTNPPVNVRGPHLLFSNGLEINLKALQIPPNATASFYLYSAVPIIYDEWRYQPPQLRIDLCQQKVTVYEWNGHSDYPSFTKSWAVPIGTAADVSVNLSKKSSTIGLQVNGHSMNGLKNRKLFNSGNVWFGADNSLGNPDWTIKSLSAQSLSGTLQVIPAGGLAVQTNSGVQALSQLAAANPRKLPIGAAIANYALFSDPGYKQLVGSQINMLVPENELKTQFIEPQPDVYSFTDADNLVDFALANRMTVHGHNLVFSEANPQWMQRALLAQRQQIMVNHISTVVSHFGTKINEWDVVDEPLNDNDDNNGNSSDLRHNIWFAAMGENYLDIAFKAAHAANPGAELYLNEYGLEAGGSRWNEFLSLVKRLQARDVPINGVGFQAHVYEPGDEISAGVLEKHMQILANMGLKSRISEMDVYGDNLNHQADQYAAGLKACLTVPSCTSFTMWGLTDRYGSTSDIHNYPLDYGNALIWDQNLKSKPAYSSLQKVLQNY